MCQFEEEDCEKQAWTRRCKENDKQTITRKYVNSCEKKVSSKLNKYSSRMVNLRFPVGRVPYRCNNYKKHSQHDKKKQKTQVKPQKKSLFAL